jgi:hypothetical protein
MSLWNGRIAIASSPASPLTISGGVIALAPGRVRTCTQHPETAIEVESYARRSTAGF